LILEALMGGAAIAEEDAALALDFGTGEEAGAGDGDESIRRPEGVAWELEEGVAVEGEGVPGAEFGQELGRGMAGTAEKVLGGVEQRERADQGVGQAFALEPRPGPGGVETLEMASAAELVGELKVMEDAEDGLDYLHALALRDFTSWAWSFSVWSA
jgi:hypothetical protein